MVHLNMWLIGDYRYLEELIEHRLRDAQSAISAYCTRAVATAGMKPSALRSKFDLPAEISDT